MGGRSQSKIGDLEGLGICFSCVFVQTSSLPAHQFHLYPFVLSSLHCCGRGTQVQLLNRYWSVDAHELVNTLLRNNTVLACMTTYTGNKECELLNAIS